MPHDVRSNLTRLQTSSLYGPLKLAGHRKPVSSLAVSARDREHKPVGLFSLLTLLFQQGSKRCGDGLLTLASLCLRDINSSLFKFDLIPAHSKNLGMAHAGVQPESDKKPRQGILIGYGASNKCLLVFSRQNDDLLSRFRPFELLPV